MEDLKGRGWEEQSDKLALRDNFDVVTERVADLHAWVNTQHRIGLDAFSTSQPIQEIPLGRAEIKDRLLLGIELKAVYSSGEDEYRLIGRLVTKPTGNTRSGATIAIPFIPGTSRDFGNPFAEELEEVPPEIRGIMEQIGSSLQGGLEDVKPPVQLQDLELRLLSKGVQNGYLILPDPENDGLIIRPRPKPEDAKEGTKIEIHAQNDDYHVEVSGEIDQDQEQFVRTINFYGVVLRDIVNTLYSIKRLPSPEKRLTIAPPKNILLKLQQQEQRLRIARSMMTASGMLEEGLADEVRLKMLAEEPPKTRFEDIGGNDEAKEVLEWAVYGLMHPEVFTEEGSDITRGVLLYGPTGTGKTLLAEAAAGEAGAAFYDVRIADIVHSLFGKSEKTIAAVFEHARNNQPAVLLFDEFNAIGGQIQNATEVSNRMVHVLLTNLQRIHSRRDRILVIATTNLKDEIYGPLTRAERFDEICEVKNPDEVTRGKIFEIHMRKAEARARRPLFSVIVLEELAKATPGFNGADIAEIVRRVTAGRVRQRRTGIMPQQTTQADFHDVLARYERGLKKSNIGFRAN